MQTPNGRISEGRGFQGYYRDDQDTRRVLWFRVQDGLRYLV